MSISSRISEELSKLSRYYGVIRCYALLDDLKDIDAKYVSNEQSVVELNGSRYLQISCELVKELVNGEGLLKANVIICNERIERCIHVARGSKVKTVEVVGREVILNVDEASEVNIGSKLAYIITNKGEVRSLRSNFNGFILLIVDIIGKPLGYVIYVVSREYVREVGLGG